MIPTYTLLNILIPPYVELREICHQPDFENSLFCTSSNDSRKKIPENIFSNNTNNIVGTASGPSLSAYNISDLNKFEI